MSTDSPKTLDTAQSPRPATRRFLRIALTGAGLLAVTAIVLFLAGIPLPADFLRTRLEGVLTDAFGVPTRIEGPLRLRTGIVATAEADALTLVNPQAPGAPALAQASRPMVRIRLDALLRGSVQLDEVAAEKITLRIERHPDGSSNWDPVFERRPGGGTIGFSGIDRLRAAGIGVRYLGPDAAAETHIEIEKFEGTLADAGPTEARGTTRLAGETLEFAITSASLGELFAPGTPLPVQAKIGWRGMSARLDGRYTQGSALLEAAVEIAAPDAGSVLSAVGMPARGAGALAARGNARLSSTGIAVRDLAFQLGNSDLSGSIGLDWAGERSRLMLELNANVLDARPFELPPDPSRDKTALETFVGILDQLTERIDIEATAKVAELTGTLSDVRDARFDIRSSGGKLNMTADTGIWGMRAKATVTYDGSQAVKTLTARVEGKRLTTAGIPKDRLQSPLAATVGDLRGQFAARGSNARDIAASLRGKVEARDLRVSWQRAGKQRTDADLASARLELGVGKPVLAEVRGRFGGQACTITGKGAALAPLLAGARWPVQLDLACPPTRLSATGHVIATGAIVTGAGTFNLRAESVRQLAAALGIPSTAPFPVAARGRLQLGTDTIRVRIDQASIGRTTGTGDVLWGLDEKGARHKVSLALSTADGDQLISLVAGTPQTKQPDVLAREILPANLRLPDLDLDLSAATLRIGETTLRKIRIDAAPQDGKLPPAHFSFDWNGAPVAGALEADFRNARPTLDLNVAVENVDFGDFLARVGRKQAGVRAAKITVRANSAGTRVDELLASATIEAMLAEGRIDRVQHLVPGIAGHGEFSGNLNVAAGRPAKLDVRGRAGNAPLEITIETGQLSELVRQGSAIPLQLRAALGKTRIEASGKVKPDGTGDARITLAGERLDHLGRLMNIELPGIGPYTAASTLTVSSDAVRASDIDARIGKSRILGAASLRRGSARPDYEADIRAPLLHIEDLGLALPAAGTSTSSSGKDASQEDWLTKERIGRYQNVLRAFDARVALDLQDLYAAGTRVARSQVGMALKGGDLRLTLDARQTNGSATADIRFDARPSPPRLRLRAQAENFEFGNILAAFNPELKSNGEFDLALEFTTTALSPPRFSDAQGHIEAAVYPRGLRLDAGRLWGLGILSIVQNTLDPGAESTVNCGVAIWDVEKGVARTEAFFADTTRVRVIGNIELELGSGRLSGNLTPRAKNPQLFSVAPAVTLSGTVDAPDATLAPMSLITAPLQFIAPLHTFAFDWLRRAGEGELGCREAFQTAREARIKLPKATPAP